MFKYRSKSAVCNDIKNCKSKAEHTNTSDENRNNSYFIFGKNDRVLSAKDGTLCLRRCFRFEKILNI